MMYLGRNDEECEQVEHLLIPPSISNPDKANLERPVIVKVNKTISLVLGFLIAQILYS